MPAAAYHHFVRLPQANDTPENCRFLVLPQPAWAKSHRSWCDVDGAGPFLVQRRTARGRAKTIVNRTDRWFYRILYAAQGFRPADRNANASLRFSRQGRDHEDDEIMAATRIRFVVAVAATEELARSLWQAVMDTLNPVGFAPGLWDLPVAAAVATKAFSLATPTCLFSANADGRNLFSAPGRLSPSAVEAQRVVAVTDFDGDATTSVAGSVASRAPSTIESRHSFRTLPTATGSITTCSMTSMAPSRLRFRAPQSVFSVTSDVATSEAFSHMSALAELRATSAMELCAHSLDAINYHSTASTSDQARASSSSTLCAIATADAGVLLVDGRHALLQPKSVGAPVPVAPGHGVLPVTGDTPIIVQFRESMFSFQARASATQPIAASQSPWSLSGVLNVLPSETGHAPEGATVLSSCVGTAGRPGELFRVLVMHSTATCAIFVMRIHGNKFDDPVFVMECLPTFVVEHVVVSCGGRVLAMCGTNDDARWLAVADMGTRSGAEPLRLLVFQPSTFSSNARAHTSLLRIAPNASHVVVALVGASTVFVQSVKDVWGHRPCKLHALSTSANVGVRDTLFMPTMPSALLVLTVASTTTTAPPLFAFDASDVAPSAERGTAMSSLHSVIEAVSATLSSMRADWEPLAVAASPEGRILHVLQRPTFAGRDRMRLLSFDLWAQDAAVVARCTTAVDTVSGANSTPARRPSLSTVRTYLFVNGTTECQLFDMYVNRVPIIVRLPPFGGVAGSSIHRVALSPNGTRLAVVNDLGALTVGTIDGHFEFVVDLHRPEFAPPGLLDRLWFDTAGAELFVRGDVRARMSVYVLSAEIVPSSDTGTFLVVAGASSRFRDLHRSVGPQSVPVHDLQPPRRHQWVLAGATLRTGFVSGYPCAVVDMSSMAASAADQTIEAASHVPPHPNVIDLLGKVVRGAVFDASAAAQSSCIALELMDCSLRDYLRKYRNRLSLAAVISLLAQVADGLDALQCVGRAHSRLTLDAIALKTESIDAQRLRGTEPTIVERLRSALGASARVASHTVLSSASTPAPSTNAPTPTFSSVSGWSAPRTLAVSGTETSFLACKITNSSSAVSQSADTGEPPLSLADIEDPFLAPERLQQTHLAPPSSEADVWALGVVILAALHLAATPPPPESGFDGDDMHWLNHAVNTRGALSLDINAKALDIAFGCLADDPASRPLVAEVSWQLWKLEMELGGAGAGGVTTPAGPFPPTVHEARRRGGFGMVPPPWTLMCSNRGFQPNPLCFSSTSFVHLPASPLASAELGADAPLVDHIRRIAMPPASPELQQRVGNFDGWTMTVLHNARAVDRFQRHLRDEGEALLRNPDLWAEQLKCSADHRSQAENDVLRGLGSHARDPYPADRSPEAPFAVPPRHRIVLAWRTADSMKQARQLAQDMPRAHAKLDDGYFGHGIYLALEPALAATYMKSAEACLLLFAVSIAQPFAVTRADYIESGNGFSRMYGQPLISRHDAHVAPVRWCGSGLAYQAANPGEQEGHELVVASHHQLVPLAVLQPPCHRHQGGDNS